MCRRLLLLALVTAAPWCAGLRAAAPPLLATAFAHWATGREDLAFTQETRIFLDNGQVKERRVERYDPSQPDSRRWRLIEVNGKAATDAQRLQWETWKNGKARKKVSKTLAEYLDVEHATPMNETPKNAHFQVGLRPAVARLVAVENVSVVVTVDKESATIARIAANLREPIRVLLGLAEITDLDLDVRMEPADGDPALKSGVVQTGSTARVRMSKFGDPMEYRWSDFRRVPTYRPALEAKTP